jgi:hypothetical protein
MRFFQIKIGKDYFIYCFVLVLLFKYLLFLSVDILSIMLRSHVNLMRIKFASNANRIR